MAALYHQKRKSMENMIKIPAVYIGREDDSPDIISLRNSAANQFTLDGKEMFPSLQAFIFGICFPDTRQKEELFFRDVVKKLNDKALFNFIVRSKTYKKEKIYWQGKVYDRFSREHYNLVSSAVYAKAESRSVQDALIATAGRRLVFTGEYQTPLDYFISRVFEKIRDEILIPV
jgi:hypothetical protein